MNSVLLEYGDIVRTGNVTELRSLLRSIWALRRGELSDQESLNDEETHRPEYQPFLTFDGDRIRANNYIGFIQNNDELIEIYPKVFRGLDDFKGQKELMLSHIFFWFDYCRRWKFPFTRANLDRLEVESFPELIINLIARQFRHVISNQPLHLYQPVEEGLRTPRGSINFARYIRNGFATGNLQIIDCDHEPFLYDNRVNRIIKYCSRLLLGRTRIAENLRILQEVVFILDDVEDVPCTLSDVDSVSINPLFDDYFVTMQASRSILANQLYSTSLNDLSQWCLLLPMEYVFEDFVAGFLQDEFGKEWKVEYQKSDKYLVDDPYKVFMLQHDIFLTAKDGSGRKLIIDTKYKVRGAQFKVEKKRGIAQSDLYQMASYAFRRGCEDVLLLYPNVSEDLNEPDVFFVDSAFEARTRIRVTAAEIPFWSIRTAANVRQDLIEALRNYLYFR